MGYIHSVLPRSRAQGQPDEGLPVVLVDGVGNLPDASLETLGRFYIVGADTEEPTLWVTVYNGSTFNWYQFGKTGPVGPVGPIGPVGVTSVSATIDGTTGTPRVYINRSEEGELTLRFTGLKGIQGNPGVNNTQMVIVSSLPENPSADTMDKIYLIFNSETGEYDRYITQFDGTDYNFVQMGSTSIDLSDYKREDSEIWLTQEEFDAIPIKDITKTYNIYEEVDDIEAGEPEPEEQEEP